MKNTELTKKQRVMMALKVVAHGAAYYGRDYNAIEKLVYNDDKTEARFWIEDSHLKTLHHFAESLNLSVVIYTHEGFKTHEDLTGKELAGFSRYYLYVGII